MNMKTLVVTSLQWQQIAKTMQKKKCFPLLINRGKSLWMRMFLNFFLLLYYRSFTGRFLSYIHMFKYRLIRTLVAVN